MDIPHHGRWFEDLPVGLVVPHALTRTVTETSTLSPSFTETPSHTVSPTCGAAMSSDSRAFSTVPSMKTTRLVTSS